MNMSDGFESMEDIFKKNPALESIRKIVKENDVINDFEKIFPDLKKVCKAVKVVKNTLYLKTESSIVRGELKFREAAIIKKINEYFNEERIKAVKFSSK